jgi:hypothetical protein
MDSIIEEKFIFINPFPEAFKSVERALAPKKPIKGTIIRGQQVPLAWHKPAGAGPGT